MFEQFLFQDNTSGATGSTTGETLRCSRSLHLETASGNYKQPDVSNKELLHQKQTDVSPNPNRLHYT